MLADFSRNQKLDEVGTVCAEDHMDDGTLLKLAVCLSDVSCQEHAVLLSPSQQPFTCYQPHGTET